MVDAITSKREPRIPGPCSLWFSCGRVIPYSAVIPLSLSRQNYSPTGTTPQGHNPTPLLFIRSVRVLGNCLPAPSPHKVHRVHKKVRSHPFSSNFSSFHLPTLHQCVLILIPFLAIPIEYILKSTSSFIKHLIYIYILSEPDRWPPVP